MYKEKIVVIGGGFAGINVIVFNGTKKGWINLRDPTSR